MRVQVEFMPSRDERAVDLRSGATGMDLLEALDLAPDAHLLVRDDAPIPADELLRDGERIVVISVVSGGRQ